MAEVVHFLMISAFFVSLLLPAGQACGTASGGVANKALLHFNLSPPPKYTYSDLPRHGQMTTAQAAESNADRDLQLAILSTLAENGIMAETVKLAYQYAAPKLYLAQGNHCTEPDTYVVYDGAILYKCVAAVTRGKRSRVKREEEDPPTEGTTETAESTSETTEIPTTVTTATETTTDSSETTTASEATTESVETTASPETKTDEPTTTVPEATTAAEPETTATAVEVETVQFQITGAVSVETPQPIFESQWRMFAEKIQEKLEEHRVFFTGAVMVEMF